MQNLLSRRLTALFLAAGLLLAACPLPALAAAGMLGSGGSGVQTPGEDTPSDVSEVPLNIRITPVGEDTEADIWVTFPIGPDGLPVDCLPAGAESVEPDKLYYVFIKPGYDLTCEAGNAQAEVTPAGMFGGYQTYTFRLTDAAQGAALTLFAAPPVRHETRDISILSFCRFPLGASINGQIQALAASSILEGSIPSVQFKEVPLEADGSFLMGLNGAAMPDTLEILPPWDEPITEPEKTDSDGWTWFRIPVPEDWPVDEPIELWVSGEKDPDRNAGTLRIEGDVDGVLKTVSSEQLRLFDFLYDGSVIPLTGGYLLTEDTCILQVADDTYAGMLDFVSASNFDGDDTVYRLYRLRPRYDSQGGEIRLKATREAEPAHRLVHVTVEAPDLPALTWWVSNKEGHGKGMVDAVAIYESFSFTVDNVDELACLVTILADGKEVYRSRTVPGAVLDLAALGAPGAAQVTIRIEVPQLHFSNAALAREAVLTEDPLGGFSGTVLAAEGSCLPDGKGIVLLKNGYDLRPLNDEVEIVASDWYYPDKATGSPADIMRYVFFSFPDFADEPATCPQAGFEIVETEPARWTEVTVQNPGGFAWELVDINDPGRILADSESAGSPDSGGNQHVWVFEPADINDPNDTGVGIRVPTDAIAMPEAYSNWRCDDDPAASYRYFASGLSGRLCFTLMDREDVPKPTLIVEGGPAAQAALVYDDPAIDVSTCRDKEPLTDGAGRLVVPARYEITFNGSGSVSPAQRRSQPGGDGVDYSVRYLYKEEGTGEIWRCYDFFLTAGFTGTELPVTVREAESPLPH